MPACGPPPGIPAGPSPLARYRSDGFAEYQSWPFVANQGAVIVRSHVVSPHAGHEVTPLLGLRRRPGRLALAVFRLPLRLYRRGWGWLLGDTFLLLVHAGRTTGKPYSTVAMVLRHDLDSRAAVICSAWGENADWIRNIQAHPALRVQIGRESFTPAHRFLPADESVLVLAEFLRRHPYRSRLISSVLGWGNLHSDAAARDFVAARPFVSLRPLASGRLPAGGREHG